MSKNVLVQCGDHFENQNRIFNLVLSIKASGNNPIVLCYDKKKSSRIFEIEKVSVVYLNDARLYGSRFSSHLKKNVFEDVIKIEKVKFPWKFTGARLENERKKVLRDYKVLNWIIRYHDIDVIGVWNGYTGYVANLLRVISDASAMPRFFMERSFFKGGLFVDQRGVNGESSISDFGLLDLEKNDYPTDVSSVLDMDLSIDINFFNFKELGYDYLIFVPLQVQTDTNNILYSPYVSTMRKLVLLAQNSVDRIREESGLNGCLVVREHPEEIESDINLPRAENIFYINSGTIKEWCLISDVVLNINSTVGLEAIYYNRPVISLGKSIYSGKGISIDSSPEALPADLSEIIAGDWNLNIDLVNMYFSILYFYNTSVKGNFPKSISSIFNKRDVCINSYRESYYKNIKEALINKAEIFVVVCFDNNPKLNLTYRNIEVSLSKDFIISNVHSILERQDIVVNIEKCESFEACNYYDFLIVNSSEYTGAVKEGFVFDEYFLPC